MMDPDLVMKDDHISYSLAPREDITMVEPGRIPAGIHVCGPWRVGNTVQSGIIPLLTIGVGSP